MPRQADPDTGFWGVTWPITLKGHSASDSDYPLPGIAEGGGRIFFWGNMLRPLIASWLEIPPSPTPESASAPAAL